MKTGKKKTERSRSVLGRFYCTIIPSAPTSPQYTVFFSTVIQMTYVFTSSGNNPHFLFIRLQINPIHSFIYLSVKLILIYKINLYIYLDKKLLFYREHHRPPPRTQNQNYPRHLKIESSNCSLCLSKCSLHMNNGVLITNVRKNIHYLQHVQIFL